MGLDVNVTYKNHETGDTLIDMEKSYCGRGMMAPVREWVGDDRYGKDILLVPDSEDYNCLVTKVATELVKRRADYTIEDIITSELGELADDIVAVPLLAKLGIDVYVEADW